MQRHLPLAILALIAFSSSADTLTGHIVAVLDGDTITLLDAAQRQHRIRLAAVDAPEIWHGKNRPGQPFGQQSKQSLFDLAYDRNAQATCPITDRYGRQVCTVYVNNVSVNGQQVARGYAWVYRQYAPQNSPLYRLEALARASGIGLWQEHNPIPPWEWRHREN